MGKSKVPRFMDHPVQCT